MNYIFENEERLFVKDGCIEFRNNQICFLGLNEMKEKHIENDSFYTLPYTIDEILNSSMPINFINYIKSIVADNIPDYATAETLLDVLSLIISRKSYKYGVIFYGINDSQENELCELLQRIFQFYISSVNSNDFFYSSKKGQQTNFCFENFVSDYIKKTGAFIVENVDSTKIFRSDIWKKLSSRSFWTCRGLYQNETLSFYNNALFIATTKNGIKFDAFDNAIANRLIVIPFCTKLTQIIIPKSEYPAIIKFLILRYITKTSNTGICTSFRCNAMKKFILEANNATA